MTEHPRNAPNRSRIIGVIAGIALIVGGLIGGSAIPITMTGGDRSDAGMIYFLMGLPVGFCFALLFIIVGIVVLVKATKPPRATAAAESFAASEVKPKRKSGWKWGVGLIALGVVGGLGIPWLVGIVTSEAGLVLVVLFGVPLGFFWVLIFVTLGIVMLVRAKKHNQNRVQSRPRNEAIPAPGTGVD